MTRRVRSVPSFLFSTEFLRNIKRPERWKRRRLRTILFFPYSALVFASSMPSLAPFWVIFLLIKPKTIGRRHFPSRSPSSLDGNSFRNFCETWDGQGAGFGGCIFFSFFFEAASIFCISIDLHWRYGRDIDQGPSVERKTKKKRKKRKKRSWGWNLRSPSPSTR